ncbi:hypothetical protein FRACYDRAFT_244198 [Fragilariopsis cylindrus CCMP1102]|uniref:Uncharacterized protein n=1 Tax=Fragilariopsis cylindrus CCMP1102 TaxID=635003 RepID=A0A1E7F465_9STRA|nr:hypothetical protein FRACYDRAFT_244198 [Fragilariopsis cylindrus CCMP1102]|eukprot:OEU12924.1 hypothetical protein FRACYDRAFT_244198 [Fragilariopsis cylindrus CCMP1102]
MILPPIVVNVVNTLAAAVVLTLASQSGRNMIQTYRIINNTKNPLLSTTTNLISLPLSNNNGVNDDDVELIVEQLKKLNREQLLQLFISEHCVVAPPESELELELSGSEWNGCLLDNNSKIMTLVSNIMTHQLFSGSFSLFGSGGGRNNNNNNHNNNMKKKNTKTVWNGKAFLPGSRGIKKSKFVKHNDETETESKSSICLNYSNYQSSPYTSLWYTMTDELRYITVPTNGDKEDGERSSCINKNILIGLGSMSWSGGYLNCSPFVLWRT